MSTTDWVLASIDDLEPWVGTVRISNNEAFQALIEQISAFMERYTDRKLLARDYSYLIAADKTDAIGDGSGQCYFFTKQWPVNTLTTLYIGDDLVTAAADWDEDGYFLYNRQGKIYYESGFDSYRHNVKLVYNAGYQTTDSEYSTLNMICCMLVAWTWDNKDRLGLKSEYLGRYRYVRGNFKDADKWIFEMLDGFKRNGIAR